MIKPLFGDNHDDGVLMTMKMTTMLMTMIMSENDPDDGDDDENEDDDDDQERGCIETAKARYNQNSSSCASIKDGAGF